MTQDLSSTDVARAYQRDELHLITPSLSRDDSRCPALHTED